MLRALWRRLTRPRRDIFTFYVGRVKRYADPLVILRRLDECGEWESKGQAANIAMTVDKSKLSPALRASVGDVGKLAGEIAEMVRKVFDVQPLRSTLPEPEGLTELECVNLFSQFLEWCARTRGDYRPLPNSPARPATSPADLDTGEYAACTSTAT